MTQKNQHKPRPPDDIIKGPLTDYYAMGINDVEITKLLKNHYDTSKYGLSVYTVRRLRKEWNILSTRKQKHSAETIYAEVSSIRERHPLRGIEGIRKTLREEHGMRVPRPLIAELLKAVEPEEVANRRPRTQNHAE